MPAKSIAVLAIVAVALVGPLVGPPAYAAWSAERSVSFVVCTGTLPAEVLYGGNSSDFLVEQYGPTPQYCQSFHVLPGASVTLPLFLHSNDLTSAHAIRLVGMLAPFATEAVSPTPPVAIAAGGNLTLSVTLQAPLQPGEHAAIGLVIAT